MFVKHLESQIAQVHSNLDAFIVSDWPSDVSRALSGPVLVNEFQLLHPKDLEKVLDEAWCILCVNSILAPCDSPR